MRTNITIPSTVTALSNRDALRVRFARRRYAAPVAFAAAFAVMAAVTSTVQAQIPRINTFFPIGGRAGTTVQVELRGSSLDGANVMLVNGSGITANVGLGGGKADESAKPLWQSKCAACHELRSPSNRSLTPDQWVATVERMVKVRQAPLSPAEQTKITNYLVSLAKTGKLSAELKIDSDVMPGLYQLRVVTTRGVSTAGLFEVGRLPEVIGANNRRETAQIVALPCVANGSLSETGERHFFRFTGVKGQRLTFNLKGFRYNDLSQQFFNPELNLYDSTGALIAENHGYYDLDPLIDWTCPADGSYCIEVRDLLGNGNPGSVYRLTMGQMPYDTVLFPPAGKAGSNAAITVVGKNTEGADTAYTLPVPADPGVHEVGSPFGPQSFFSSEYPVVRAAGSPGAPIDLPSGMAGRILSKGEAQTFPVHGDGTFEFESYTSRLGSTADVRVTLLNGQGGGIVGMNGDERMTAKLEKGQNYALKIEQRGDAFGPGAVYFVEARPARPRLEVVMHPSNISLRPGMSTAVEVVLQRREGVEGDVVISADSLPPGVTAQSTVIQPDRNSNLMIFTASSTATPVAAPFTVHATAHGPMGDVSTEVTPQDIYQMNNNPIYEARTSCVAAVRGEPDFTASLVSNQPIKVHPRKGVEVKIKIARKAAFKGNVQVQMRNLPSGWVANAETAGPDKDVVTLLVRPDGNDTRPFLNRDKNMSPIYAVILANSDEFEFVAGTALVVRADRIDDDEKSSQ